MIDYEFWSGILIAIFGFGFMFTFIAIIIVAMFTGYDPSDKVCKTILILFLIYGISVFAAGTWTLIGISDYKVTSIDPMVGLSEFIGWCVPSVIAIIDIVYIVSVSDKNKKK